MLSINLLEMLDGECIHIKNCTKDGNNNIIIDSGGRARCCFNNFKKLLESIKNENEMVDALIITHIDDDHIYGLFNLLNSGDTTLVNIIKKVYINDAKIEDYTGIDHTSKSAISVLEKLRNLDIEIESQIISGMEFEISNMKLKILTPDKCSRDIVAKEIQKADTQGVLHAVGDNLKIDIDKIDIDRLGKDTSATNKASISFILKNDDKQYLFLGDAHIDCVLSKLKSAENLNFEIIKLSHHGSSKNINLEFVNLVKCNKFLVARKKVFEKETLKLLLKNDKPIEIFCKYVNDIFPKGYFTENDKVKYIDSNLLTYTNGDYIE